jgi:hypothetical protein
MTEEDDYERLNLANLLIKKTNTIENIVKELSNLHSRPILCVDKNSIQRLYFAKPDIKNYLSLSFSRSISAFRSAILLYANGFMYNSMILLRIITENEFICKYVSCGITSNGIDSKTARYLKEYFGDTERDFEKRTPFRKINQKEINNRISESMMRDISEYPELFSELPKRSVKEISDSYSYMYNFFSSFVHGNYPESMFYYSKKTRELNLVGNYGEYDFHTEIELFKLVFDSIEKNLKYSIIKLIISNEIITQKLRKYALENVF